MESGWRGLEPRGESPALYGGGGGSGGDGGGGGSYGSSSGGSGRKLICKADRSSSSYGDGGGSVGSVGSIHGLLPTGGIRPRSIRAGAGTGSRGDARLLDREWSVGRWDGNVDDGQLYFASILLQRWTRYRVLRSPLYELVVEAVMKHGSAIELQVPIVQW